MRLDDFDYHLPAELIAQHPPEERGASRLLCLDRGTGAIAHHTFRELPSLLPAGVLLVVNDSRVIPARLRARRASGGRVEVLLVEKLSGGEEIWSCMLRSSKPLGSGERLAVLPGPGSVGTAPQLELLERPAGGRGRVRVIGEPDLLAHGSMSLPPYIRRQAGAGDVERYQTIYAREQGSVAAPTAGLHFTEAVLLGLERAGIERCSVTLHVGPGTFQPVRSHEIDEHRMEAERYEVPAGTAGALARARGEGRRVVAVGTTTARTLEGSGGRAGHGRTELFIRPGHRFAVVDGLLTNFHLPRSTLLMLVSAFAGRERVLAAYAEAVASRYRFYSYGDAMLIL